MRTLIFLSKRFANDYTARDKLHVLVYDILPQNASAATAIKACRSRTGLHANSKQILKYSFKKIFKKNKENNDILPLATAINGYVIGLREITNKQTNTHPPKKGTHMLTDAQMAAGL